MTGQPTVVQRAEQRYVAIKALVTMQTLGEVLPELHPQVGRWLRSQGLQAAGQPFCKFNLIDMDRQLEVEAGFPVAEPVTGDSTVLAASLPAGRYATLWYTGHPDGLVDATGGLLVWAAEQGLSWDMTHTSDGERWRCRLEISHDVPGQDMSQWQTELAFKLDE